MGQRATSLPNWELPGAPGQKLSAAKHGSEGLRPFTLQSETLCSLPGSPGRWWMACSEWIRRKLAHDRAGASIRELLLRVMLKLGFYFSYPVPHSKVAAEKPTGCVLRCVCKDRWTATELQAALELVPKRPPSMRSACVQ